MKLIALVGLMVAGGEIKPPLSPVEFSDAEGGVMVDRKFCRQPTEAELAKHWPELADAQAQAQAEAERLAAEEAARAEADAKAAADAKAQADAEAAANAAKAAEVHKTTTTKAKAKAGNG